MEKLMTYGIVIKSTTGQRNGPVFTCKPRHCWQFAKSILFDRGYSNRLEWDLVEFPLNGEPTTLTRPATELGPVAEHDDHAFWG